MVCPFCHQEECTPWQGEFHCTKANIAKYEGVYHTVCPKEVYTEQDRKDAELRELKDTSDFKIAPGTRCLLVEKQGWFTAKDEYYFTFVKLENSLYFGTHAGLEIAIPEARVYTKCHNCSRTGIYGGSADGYSGHCYRCNGAGWQSHSDRLRNATYDRQRRR